MNKFFIFFIRIYQWTISPFLGGVCRFYPSCSDYCIQAIQKYGIWKGCYLGMKRILRCAPWSKGGVDPP